MVATGDEKPVLTVAYDLGYAACCSREDRGADGEGLDDGVGEVLPLGREDRAVGGSEELEDAPARLRAEEPDSRAEAEAARPLLELAPLRPLAGDDERDALRRRHRLERDAERLLRAQPSREGEGRPVQAQRASELVAAGEPVDDGRRVREDAHALRRDAPRDRQVTQPPARAEDVRRAPELSVAQRAQDALGRAAPGGLESLDVALNEPAPPRAFERGVGGQLEHVRPPRGERTGRRAPEHAGRVDELRGGRASPHQPQAAQVPDADR